MKAHSGGIGGESRRVGLDHVRVTGHDTVGWHPCADFAASMPATTATSPLPLERLPSSLFRGRGFYEIWALTRRRLWVSPFRPLIDEAREFW